MNISIKNNSPHALPSYATIGSAGMDLRAYLTHSITIAPMERKIIETGIFIATPIGFEAQIRPRSGLAFKHGITVLNSPGTIDSDYRGEIKVLLINLSHVPFVVHNGERIAQMVIIAHEKITWKLVNELPITQRGEKGYGSTGIQ